MMGLHHVVAFNESTTNPLLDKIPHIEYYLDVSEHLTLTVHASTPI